MARRAVAGFGEAGRVVVEDQAQEIVLDIPAPKWDAILLLKMTDLGAGEDGGDGTAGVAADGGGEGGVRGVVAARIVGVCFGRTWDWGRWLWQRSGRLGRGEDVVQRGHGWAGKSAGFSYNQDMVYARTSKGCCGGGGGGSGDRL